MQHPDTPPDPPSDNNSFLFDLYSTPPPFNSNPSNQQDDSLIIESRQSPTPVAEGNDHQQFNTNAPASDSNSYLFDLFSTPQLSQVHSEQSITSPISPQDSQMGSPESEEPTRPQPEEIVVFPRSASHTPQVRSRPLSAASNWTHASEEDGSVSDQESPTRVTIPPPPIRPQVAAGNFGEAASGKYIPYPADINEEAAHSLRVDLSNEKSRNEVTEAFYIVQQDLNDEITREITEAALGYGQYYLKEPKLTLRPQHDFVLKQNQLQTAALVTIQALDAGTALHPGDTSTTFLTPQAWFCLAAATLAAIIRGNIRSPNNAINGIKPLNTNDKFEIHKDLVHPLTEGATIRHMALQIAEAYDKARTNPLKLTPTEVYDQLTAVKLATLTKAAETSAKSQLDTTDIHNKIRQDLINNPAEMEQIQHSVKEAIFQELNKEALEDLDTWREIYREEFKD
ncbi:hypothetical protein EDB87DRAFT_1689719, partial [Lactarius vividus]